MGSLKKFDTMINLYGMIHFIRKNRFKEILSRSKNNISTS